MPLGNPEAYLYNQNFGGALGTAGGAAIGGAFGGIPGALLGAGVGGTLGSSFGQQQTQPFTFPFIKPNTFGGINAGKEAGIFGPGAINPGALGGFNQQGQGTAFQNPLLPTGGGAVPAASQIQVGLGQPQGQTQGQQTTDTGMDVINAKIQAGLSLSPEEAKQLAGAGGISGLGKPAGYQNLSPDKQKTIDTMQGLENDIQKAYQTGNYKKAQRLEEQLQKFKNKLGVTAQGISEGKTPFGTQLGMESAGLGNLGLGFGGAQQFGQQGFENLAYGQQQALALPGQNQQRIGQVQDIAARDRAQAEAAINKQFGFTPQTFGQATDILGSVNVSGVQGIANQSANEAFKNVGIGRDLTTAALGDKDLARNILLEDRAARDTAVQQALDQGIPPDLETIADAIATGQIDIARAELTTGATGQQLEEKFAGARQAAAARGLGLGSSTAIQARQNVELERERLLAQAVEQANVQRNQNLLTLRDQQQRAALEASGQLGQSAISSLQQFAPLIQAGTGGLQASTQAIGAAQESGQLLNEAERTKIAQAQALGQIGTQQGQVAGQQIGALQASQAQQQQTLQNLGQQALAGDTAALQALQGLASQATAGVQAQTGLGQLGLTTQDTGQDQIMSMLQLLFQQLNNKQKIKFGQQAAGAGAQFSL